MFATIAESQQRGPVAQLGARFHGMEEVIGSIPIRSTKESSLAIGQFRTEFRTSRKGVPKRGALPCWGTASTSSYPGTQPAVHNKGCRASSASAPRKRSTASRRPRVKGSGQRMYPEDHRNEPFNPTLYPPPACSQRHAAHRTIAPRQLHGGAAQLGEAAE